ncbi:SEL1-like repeat protein [Pasteurella atlantica]|uniref:SEL1-like repeat protein n=1 Tax=Pasteurellaceae TaxID=712 RepID=UPI0027749BE9|nr:SEL1-like repeat protein [Pasteurella atlantica]MDP8033557.1 SEL1-like repeat protein [Pasteurella atlantica]MDP8035492.1 SEL1-like repeat protein [Pasteurella atlantica]MDP8037443.1 SEL1-like repeat protein [Pasteurella atlantica]MDP8047792.1 SEL1-like repeat protein [Pasteurella atlantica]MDP8049647.1 SEL1-like repeat protein [Pasteurella atlantica]
MNHTCSTRLANLGYMYEMGYGVEKSYSKAIERYRKAARQGNETAKRNLKGLGEKE